MKTEKWNKLTKVHQHTKKRSTSSSKINFSHQLLNNEVSLSLSLNKDVALLKSESAPAQFTNDTLNQ